ncbi:MAG: prephenate dehydrogenase [Myxococcota bacterium]
MTAPFERLLVVGLGLLGGSVAWAAKQREVANHVVGATRSPNARAQALRFGAVDAIAELDVAGRDADLVVLATPVGAMPRVLESLAPSLGAGCLVTDVGSVKGPLVETLPGILPPGAQFVGSHPMAGGHETGMEHARPDLLDGAVCVVTEADGEATARVAGFWEALGAQVVRRGPAAHDAEVAWISHLPHLLAYAYAASLEKAPGAAAEVAGAGFRDFSRIARSDPGLWADILSQNHKALAAPVAATGQALEDLARALEAGDAEALFRLLSAARSHLFPAPLLEEPAAGSDVPNAARARGDSTETPK